MGQTVDQAATPDVPHLNKMLLDVAARINHPGIKDATLVLIVEDAAFEEWCRVFTLNGVTDNVTGTHLEFQQGRFSLHVTGEAESIRAALAHAGVDEDGD